MVIHFRDQASSWGVWLETLARCGYLVSYDVWYRTTRRWAKVTCKRCIVARRPNGHLQPIENRSGWSSVLSCGSYFKVKDSE